MHDYAVNGLEKKNILILILVASKVQLENSSGPTGDSQKIKLVLAVRVEKLEVDLVAGCLRVNGKNVKENKHVKVKDEQTIFL